MPSDSLVSRRLARLWAALADQNLDAVVVFGKGAIGSYGGIEWTSGYSPVVRAANVVLLPGRAPVLVVPTAADAYYARHRAGASDVRQAGQGDIVSEYDDLASGVAGVLTEAGVAGGRIGAVGLKHHATAHEAERFAAVLPGATIVDVTAAVAAVKTIKEPEEIEALVATAVIADRALEACLPLIRPGATGWDLNAAMEGTGRGLGVKDALIFASAGAYFLERPTDEPFAQGDLLSVYVEIVGPTGYWVELARLVAIGALDPERMRLAEACLEAARAAEEGLVAGKAAGAAAAAIDAVAQREGVRVGIWHGHGVGVDHDLPVITAADTTELRENMVIAVHPNFSSADERIAASVADTYVIGTGTPRRLSAIDPGLITV